MDEKMKITSPIRDKKQIELIKMYLKNTSLRNYILFIIGINTNLRISDILALKVTDVWDKKKPREFIEINEKKTGKNRRIMINDSLGGALKEYMRTVNLSLDEYLFCGKKGGVITRQQAHRILQDAGDKCGLAESLSPHSLRKTWGYWAWKSGVSPILIMEALSHSNITITKRYIGILQEDIDEVFINLNL